MNLHKFVMPELFTCIKMLLYGNILCVNKINWNFDVGNQNGN